jgi:uncharacterized repeat protein (TIGR01451 family)
MKRYMFVLSSIFVALIALAGITSVLQGQVRAAPPQALPPAPLLATQQISPTYTVTDSTGADVTYNWVEIAGTGAALTPLSGGNDNGYATVDLGFYFPFYAGVYRQAQVSANGHVFFGGDGSNAAVVSAIPFTYTPNNLAAGFGADLFRHGSVSAMYFERQTSPEERGVIEFVDMQWCCGLNDPHTFEIILYPDGRILAQYNQIRYQSNPHAWVVVGIENEDGTDGLVYYDDWFDENDALDDGLAVLFDPGDSLFGEVYLFPESQTVWEDREYPLSFNADVVNLSGVTTTFDVSYTLHVSSSAVPSATLWPVGVPTRTAAITCPGFANLSITTTIPITADWDDLAVLSVTVRSTVSSTVSRTLWITYGVAQRDLQVGKGLASMAPAPGGSFRYRVVVTNTAYPGSNRGATARGVVVTDVLPISVTLTDSGVVTWTGTVDGRTVLTWNVGSLYDGEVDALLITMDQVPTVPIGTWLTNTAYTTMTLSDERGPFDNNQVDFAFQVIPPSLNFIIDKYFPGPNIISPGRVVTYNVDFYNAHNIYVDDVIITDTLPTTTTFVGTTWPTYTLIGNQVVFTVPRVFNGSWNALRFQIGVSVPVDFPLDTWMTNTVEITTTASLAGFTYQEGDTDSESILVRAPAPDPIPDLWVDKQLPAVGSPPQPLTPMPGGDYRFWIHMGNSGTTTAYSVTLVDTLPLSYVTLIQASNVGAVAPVTSTPGVITWTLSQLTPGQSRWANVLLLIDDNAPAGLALVNGVEITSTNPVSDAQLANNVSVVSATLRGADVTVRKTVVPVGNVQPGERLTYTLRFSNTGELTATGVHVRDWLPDGLADVVSSTSGIPLTLEGVGPPLDWYAPGTLPAGASGVIIISARVDENYTWSAGSVLTNVATIATVIGELPGDNPNSDTTVNAIKAADPYVSKSGGTLALPGEWLTYTVEYGNLGNLDASSVWLTDTLPVNTTYVSDTSGFLANQAGNQVGWNVGSILSQTTDITFSLVLSVSPATPVGTALVNTLDVSSSSYDGDQTNNQATWRTAVGFDLTPSHKLADGTAGEWVNPGQQVTYTVVLTNAGPYSATGVLLNDPIPTYAAYVDGSLAATSGSWGESAGVVTWTGTVTGYTEVSVTFQVTVAEGLALPRGTEVVNTATISEGVNDILASVPVTLTGPMLDVAATAKTVSNGGPISGDVISYTIVVQNDGEVDAQATVTDALPGMYVDYTGNGSASSGTLYDSGTPITWTGTVMAGERVTITLPVTVTALGGVSFDNTAQIADGTGNVFERTRGVTVRAPDLDNSNTTKAALPGSVNQNDAVNFVITVVNNGSGPAPSARVTDTLPADAAYSSGATASLPGLDDSGAPTIFWAGSLVESEGGPNDRVVITIPVQITAAPGSDVVNFATIDDGLGNVFQRQATVHVYTQADLSTSDKVVWPQVAAPSAMLYYTLTVRNGGETAASFVVTDTLDADTTYVSGSASPTPVSAGGGVIVWNGTVNGGSQTVLTFRATLNPTTRPAVTNTARFDDGVGNVTLDTAVTQLAQPELDGVKLAQPGGVVQRDELIVYTIVLSNIGNAPVQFTMSDPMPAYSTYMGGLSVDPPGFPTLPVYHPTTDTVTFNGVLQPAAWVTVSFGIELRSDTPTGAVITNTATLDALNDVNPAFTREVAVVVGSHQLFLPVVMRNSSSP